ncbi:MAG: DUF4197 domain-containing protein [Bacteroidales bacterium]|nr:DUF4197 domain-containing protein [Bacteroidales bacterium]
MKKIIAILSVVVLLSSCDVLMDVLGDLDTGGGTTQLTQAEVAQGLKEALTVGIGNVVNVVAVTDGFYKNSEIRIPFPEEAIKVKEFCINAGLKNQVTQFEEKLNRAAEEAAKGSKEVFVTAIKQMTISDAITILKGGDDAATQYLKKTTSTTLYNKFYPVVVSATDKIMLAKYWTPLVEKYNTAMTITGGEKVNTDLNAYVTNKALDGLYLMVAKEEKKIRVDPVARVTDILVKVFGSTLNPHNSSSSGGKTVR